MKRLIQKWKRLAAFHEKRSIKTWDKLSKRDLPQEDDIIYSVYEDQKAAGTYLNCARDLEEFLKAQGPASSSTKRK